MEYILKTNNLSKTLDNKEIVKRVNLKVKKGEIYGLVGLNGAGKTTIIKLITNLLRPTAGNVEIFDKEVNVHSYEIFKKLGLMIDTPVFYNNLTCQEILELHCDYMGYHRTNAVNDTLNIVGLSACNNTVVRNMSLGMKQRLGLARAIITKPELLILDEPINGLDPQGIKEFRELMKKLNIEYNMTILLSSHILAELEHIADSIGIIDNGKLIKETTMKSIRESSLDYIEVAVDSVNKASFVLSEKTGVSNYKVMDNNTIRIYDSKVKASDISRDFSDNNVLIDSVARKQSSLEDYFFKTIKEEN